MRVNLASLKPNPCRDFAVDPVDEAQVAVLTQSIKENDFWGGVVARQTNDGIEVIAGLHRTRAAKKAGLETADIYVAPKGKISDADAIRIYATENATHRGQMGTGLTGSVAAAIKFLARGLLSGDFRGFPQKQPQDVCKLKGNLQSEKGIGRDLISAFLDGIPGINKNTVQQQIANLKQSGIYDRIIGEIQAEVAAKAEAETKAAAKARREADEARKAAETAAAERKAADEKRAKEREEAAKLKAKRDAEIAAEKEAKKKKQLEEQAKRDAARAAKAEHDRKQSEMYFSARAAEAEKRQKEAEEKNKIARAAQAKAAAEKEAADRAKAAAAEQKRKLAEANKLFDFEGVAKHIKVADHIDYFREYVTETAVAHYLKRDEQAPLAERLVAEFEELNADARAKGRPALTSFSSYIRDNIMEILESLKRKNRSANEAERRKAEEADFRLRADRLFKDFNGYIRSAHSHLLKLIRLQKEHPEIELQLSLTFKQGIDRAIEMLGLARKEGLTDWMEPASWNPVHTAVPKAAKIAAMLDNDNAGERHNAADLLFRMAREKKLTIAQLLEID